MADDYMTVRTLRIRHSGHVLNYWCAECVAITGVLATMSDARAHLPRSAYPRPWRPLRHQPKIILRSIEDASNALVALRRLLVAARVSKPSIDGTLMFFGSVAYV
jgi:hypothetical protein